MQTAIEKQLHEALRPSHLEVINESHQHNVPARSETHFKVVCVSAVFEGMRAVQRHQKVYGLLSDCFSRGLHALALHLYTPEEWAQRQMSAPASPRCLGGSAEKP